MVRSALGMFCILSFNNAKILIETLVDTYEVKYITQYFIHKLNSLISTYVSRFLSLERDPQILLIASKKKNITDIALKNMRNAVECTELATGSRFPRISIRFDLEAFISEKIFWNCSTRTDIQRHGVAVIFDRYEIIVASDCTVLKER